MMRTPNFFHTTLIAHRGADRPNLLVVSVVDTSERYLSSLSPCGTKNTDTAGIQNRAEHEHSEAAYRPDALSVGVTGNGDTVRCFGTFVETKHERSLSLDTTIIDRQSEEMYFTKEEPKMADHLHPMEGAILDFSVTRMRLIELFSRDGEICADEQATLDLFDDAKRTVSALHNLDRAVETYKKQYRHGITRYGRQKWNLAGLAVEPYDPDAA